MDFGKSEQDILRKIMIWRRDVRGHHFSQEPVSDETVKVLLEAAILAPSVGFSQPWRFVLVKDPALRKRVKESFDRTNELSAKAFTLDKGRKYRNLKLEGILEAPINIAVFYSDTGEPVLGREAMPETGPYSVVCAIQNMWLMARAHNLGLGWVSILDSGRVSSILSAPKNMRLIAYLCIGYLNTHDDEPELKKKGWERAVPMDDLVFTDGFSELLH